MQWLHSEVRDVIITWIVNQNRAVRISQLVLVIQVAVIGSLAVVDTVNHAAVKKATEAIVQRKVIALRKAIVRRKA